MEQEQREENNISTTSWPPRNSRFVFLQQKMNNMSEVNKEVTVLWIEAYNTVPRAAHTHQREQVCEDQWAGIKDVKKKKMVPGFKKSESI